MRTAMKEQRYRGTREQGAGSRAGQRTPSAVAGSTGRVDQRRIVRGAARGFTLVELLVVISIIALLVALLLPAFGAIRNTAKVTSTTAEFQAIATGLDLFRAEQSLGGTLPPSSSDANDQNKDKIAFPLADPPAAPSNPDTFVTGAHLLAFALVGADLRGTAGFKDIDADGFWSDDSHNRFNATQRKENGTYAADTDPNNYGQPAWPRYPSSGSYVADDLKTKRVETLNAMKEEGRIFNYDLDQPFDDDNTGKLPLFVDAWDRPILYYRANRAARLMVQDEKDKAAGVYRQEDNGLITGTSKAAQNRKGLDFGRGPDPNTGLYCDIADATAPTPNYKTEDIQGESGSTKYQYTFARFIHNPKVKTANEPVRKDSYLLISAGPDGTYGTTDDVVNWSRETDQ